MTPLRRRLAWLMLTVGAMTVVFGVAGLVGARQRDRREISTVLETPPPPSPSPGAETAELFVARLDRAIDERDNQFLRERLHPSVIELYGQVSCKTHVESVLIDPSPTLRLRKVQNVSGWAWEVDGKTVPIGEAMLIEIDQVFGDRTTPAQFYAVLVGDALRWFTDCGKPLPFR